MERNLSIKEEAKRHNNADSLSYISEDTLVLYKGNIETDTIVLNSPKGCVRGIYIYTDEGIVTLKGGYNLSNGILRKVNVDKIHIEFLDKFLMIIIQTQTIHRICPIIQVDKYETNSR